MEEIVFSRKDLDRLQRRLNEVTRRVDSSIGSQNSLQYDRAERGALIRAIKVLEKFVLKEEARNE